MNLRLKAVYIILDRQPFCTVSTWLTKQVQIREAPWPSGRASDIGARGRGFVPYSARCILEQDTFTSQKVLVIPRKRWLRPDMTEKLLTET